VQQKRQLLDDFVGAGEQARWNLNAKLLGRLKVNIEHVVRRLLYRQLMPMGLVTFSLKMIRSERSILITAAVPSPTQSMYGRRIIYKPRLIPIRR